MAYRLQSGIWRASTMKIQQCPTTFSWNNLCVFPFSGQVYPLVIKSGNGTNPRVPIYGFCSPRLRNLHQFSHLKKWRCHLPLVPHGETHPFWSPLFVPCDCAVAKAFSSAPESLMASNSLGGWLRNSCRDLKRSSPIPPHLIPIPVILIHIHNYIWYDIIS